MTAAERRLLNRAGRAELSRVQAQREAVVAIQVVVRERLECAHCDEFFWQAQPHQRFCSHSCRALAWKLVNRERASQRSAREWREEARFSLPGDGGRMRRAK